MIRGLKLLGMNPMTTAWDDQELQEYVYLKLPGVNPHDDNSFRTIGTRAAASGRT